MYCATSQERVRSALSHLSPESRGVWVRQAMAIKSEFGEDGFEMWDQWSSLSSAYRAIDARHVWKSVKAGKGIGIGLSTCMSIVAKHHGEITVKSEPGQGATFTVKFPLNPEILP